MTTTDPNEFLATASFDSNPGFKFAAIGDTCEGRIVSTPRVVETDDLNGGRSPKLVVDVETADGTFALWLPQGKGVTRAVAAAVKEAGADGLAEGGQIKVRYDADGDQPKAGFHPPKLFRAKYTPPTPTVPVPEDEF